MIKNKYLIIKSEKKISDAIYFLEKSSQRILFVVDKKNKYLGTVTDGDIRRGLLKKFTLDDEIKKISNLKSKFVYDKNIDHQINKMKLNDGIRILPVLNKKTKKIIDIKRLDFFPENSLSNTPILIMAGGKGKRLLPFTKNCPKPLLKIKNTPMIERIILKFKNQGFKKFYISINYLGHMIKNYLGDGDKLGVNINYINEKKFLGTIGSFSLLNGKSVKFKNIIVINGDIITDLNFYELLNYHLSNGSYATIVCRNREIRYPFGIVLNKGKNLTSFKEKPVFKNLINAGIYCLRMDSQKYIKKNKKLDIHEFLLKMKKNKKKILVYPIVEEWYDVGNIEIYNSFNEF